MTDREKLLALLANFGLAPDVPEVVGGEVSLIAKEGGVQGYDGFHCTFSFDDYGAFTRVGIWE